MRRLPLAAAAALLLSSAVPTQAAAPAPVGDPAGWSDRRLAAQLLFAGYDARRTDDALPLVREGLGGVVLFGPPPGDLRHRLARLRAAGPVPPAVASDEEGGRVQRLRALLGPLPSAEAMGRTRTPAQVRDLATRYARGMRGLGVDVALSPVADLQVPGTFLERTDRAFAAAPATVTSYAGAWQAGMRSAGVVPAVKHWPGHGSASDTHVRGATTPPLGTLQRRDLLPFDALLRAGVPAVMVGHLQVPGLTEPGLPATLSPGAYRYLRSRAQDRVLMTDSLSMGAITVGQRLTPAQAAVRALRAGADVALVDPGYPHGRVVDAVAGALASGAYPRAAAVASARRVLAMKRHVHAPAPLTSLVPAAATTGASLTPTLSAVARDPLGQDLTVRFYVRRAGAPRWDVVNAAQARVRSGARAAYRIRAGRLLPGTAYDWQARSCTAAAPVRCAAPSPVLRLTTRTLPPAEPPPAAPVPDAGAVLLAPAPAPDARVLLPAAD